ncbi:hypothetical protein P171DRAFT_486417 [Karstenula rhodostoma CBS 690.94]|uniref:F-box domain-containing protein n=1 Tax=Karstenula rhodostoma CBS 690.94 TaxID=1392251 RepID=A0A9P4PGW5_9PLEO|nr:hypothetical protein P171DRAFT_486417 [Karstenula rhodostoma CBS 690.94]
MPSLPAELWEHIFTYLECRMPIEKWWYYGEQYDVSSLRDLASLSLVCRAFHHIAQPFMYRTIPADGFQNLNKCKALLARSLIENPRLAAYARNVCLDSSSSWDVEPVEFEGLLDRGDVGEREKRWLNMTMMESSKLRRNAQLFALMRNLHVVDVSVFSDASHIAGMLSGRSDVETIVQAEANLMSETGYSYKRGKEELRKNIPSTLTNETLADNALPRLKELRIRHGDCEDGSISISDIEAVLLHPGLERLYLLGFDWSSFGLRKARWPLHPNPTLQILDLRDCLVDTQGLRNILERFESLHTLHIILGDSRRENPSFDMIEDTRDVSLTDIGAVLRKHARNLVSFELHTTGYRQCSGVEGRLRSLKEMTSLRHLKIVEHDLRVRRTRYGVSTKYDTLPLEDVLPAGLETLYLHYDDCYFGPCAPDTHLFEILGRMLRSGKVPELREIKVERYLNDSTKELKPEIEGWKVCMKEEHLWGGPTSSGCMRLVIELTRLDE